MCLRSKTEVTKSLETVKRLNVSQWNPNKQELVAIMKMCSKNISERLKHSRKQMSPGSLSLEGSVGLLANVLYVIISWLTY